MTAGARVGMVAMQGLLLVAAACSRSAPATDLTGVWTGRLQANVGGRYDPFTLYLTQVGGSLTGCVVEHVDEAVRITGVRGRLYGSTVRLTCANAKGTMEFIGACEKGTIRAKCSYKGRTVALSAERSPIAVVNPSGSAPPR